MIYIWKLEMKWEQEKSSFFKSLTTLFRFKSFDKLLEFILISRQTEENIDIELLINTLNTFL